MSQLIVASEGHGDWGRPVIDYLLQLAFPDREICWQRTADADLIVRSHFFNQEPELETSRKIPYILWSGESVPIPERGYPPICKLYSFHDGTVEASAVPTYYLPFILFADYELPKIRQFDNLDRRHFVAYCSTNPVATREELFKLLREREPAAAHGLGGCSNSFGGKKMAGDWHTIYKVYSQYYFVLAMENTIKPGYVTEKLMNAYMAGAIPIYWGDAKQVKEWFNPRSLVCVNDFGDLAECADYIHSLYKNMKRLHKKMHEPIFRNGVIPELFRLEKSAPQYYQDIAATIWNGCNGSN